MQDIGNKIYNCYSRANLEKFTMLNMFALYLYKYLHTTLIKIIIIIIIIITTSFN
jgi:hypothetical protein